MNRCISSKTIHFAFKSWLDVYCSSFATLVHHDAVRWYNRYCLDSIRSITANSVRWAYLHLYASRACLLFISFFVILSSQMQQRAANDDLWNCVMRQTTYTMMMIMISGYLLLATALYLSNGLSRPLFAIDCWLPSFKIWNICLMNVVACHRSCFSLAYTSCLMSQS